MDFAAANSILQRMVEQKHINLVKLCVGAEKVEDLEHWQQQRRALNPNALTQHVTRMWPKKSDELLSGGSLYWVFKGVILARQRVLRLDEVHGDDGIRRCGIVLEPNVIRTEAVPRRPFQGWRYLKPEDSPQDLPEGRKRNEDLPPSLMAALAEIGVR
ncbi:DUF1489 family protein [Actibacterium lipolyticum]|uniref:DUF1489 domain-containing protein n=1 Tax=Actibacterium lipolyticum TaxID=1524263 RepID=A0A238JKW5_9RHOB|nr:DUF1489 domain-containing protein [Actibacterium lipolyticum]SMX31300.1 hypothetical protein COL8621_00378 [Actibacterium lipolyticum]